MSWFTLVESKVELPKISTTVFYNHGNFGQRLISL